MAYNISANQAQQQWEQSPAHYKRKASAAPKGAQQFGDPDRYIRAGIAPGWYNPALNNQKQYEKLRAAERARFAPKPVADTRRFGAGINPNTLFQSDLQGLLAALTRGTQAAQQNAPQREAFSPEIQAIRDQYLQSLL